MERLTSRLRQPHQTLEYVIVLGWQVRRYEFAETRKVNEDPRCWEAITTPAFAFPLMQVQDSCVESLARR
jgi:ABC-type Fe3+ transport system substrate-binding protein